ncbi:MAG: membrane protein insertase YidC [Nannocystaceae bacterium]
MTFNQRLWLTMLLCAGIIALSSTFSPPPVAENAGETADTSDAASVDSQRVVGALQQPSAEPGEPGEQVGLVGRPPGEVATLAVDVVTRQLSTDALTVDLTNAAGGILAAVEPLAEQFRGEDGRGVDFLGLGGTRQSLELGFDASATDFAYPLAADLEVLDDAAKGFSVRWRSTEVEIRQAFWLERGYEASYEVRVVNRSPLPQRHRLRLRSRYGVEEQNQFTVNRALCHLGEGALEEFSPDDVEDGPQTVSGKVRWAAVDSRYFLHAVVPEMPATTCQVAASEDGALLENTLFGPAVMLEPGEQRVYRFGVYLGAKEQSRLGAFSLVDGAHLEDAVDWGWFGATSRYLGRWMLKLLRFFHEFTGSWGVAILLLTVVVKALTLPLTLKQIGSMKRMREIQPEMAALKEKYGADKVKLQQEMQALWSRTGVNPLAGCLPALVQMPIWIALYAMLPTVVELYHEPFLWLADLTRPDPYYALPLAMGGLMFLQTRIQPTPATQDPMQAKMMQWMLPGFFTFMLLMVPSGLGVYMLSNVLLSLIQTAIQLRPDKNKKPAVDTASS